MTAVPRNMLTKSAGPISVVTRQGTTYKLPNVRGQILVPDKSKMCLEIFVLFLHLYIFINISFEINKFKFPTVELLFRIVEML